MKMNKAFENFLLEEDRLKTFVNWPYKQANCSPEKLAKAGFYYTGLKTGDDDVRCFVCFKELNGWDVNDNPFEEHEKHSKNCDFVRLGQDQSNLKLIDFITLLEKSFKNTLNYVKERKIKEELELIKSFGLEF